MKAVAMRSSRLAACEAGRKYLRHSTRLQQNLSGVSLEFLCELPMDNTLSDVVSLYMRCQKVGPMNKHQIGRVVISEAF